MTRADPRLAKVRAICLSFPNTKETLTWGKPHFRVGEKIFAGYGEERGLSVIGFKLEMRHAADIVRDPRFWKAPYVGHKGWVSMDVSGVSDWDEVRRLIHESYLLIAPKKKAVARPAKRAAASGGKPGARRKTARKR